MKRILEIKTLTNRLFGIVRNPEFVKQKTNIEPKNVLTQSQICDSFQSTKTGRLLYAEAEIRRSQAIIEARQRSLR